MYFSIVTYYSWQEILACEKAKEVGNTLFDLRTVLRSSFARTARYHLRESLKIDAEIVENAVDLKHLSSIVSNRLIRAGTRIATVISYFMPPASALLAEWV